MEKITCTLDERVDLLPPLNSHKSSGKLVLERPELGKSCLRQDATLFAEDTKFARDIFCQKRQKMRVTSFVRAHCLTKNLPLDSSQIYLYSKYFPTLQQDHLFSYVAWHNGMEVVIMCSLRQIFQEAISGISVVGAERFCVRPIPGRQTWERA